MWACGVWRGEAVVESSAVVPRRIKDRITTQHAALLSEYHRELKGAGTQRGVSHQVTNRNQETAPHLPGWRKNLDVVGPCSGGLFGSHCNANES